MDSWVKDEIARRGGRIIPDDADPLAFTPFGGAIKGVKALRALKSKPRVSRGGKADPQGVGFMEMFKIADDTANVGDTVAEYIRRMAVKNKLPIMGVAAADQVKQREPFPSELDYFKANPHVAGMAAEDNSVIINPYSKLSDKEKAAVVENETARVLMRKPELSPVFELTPEQQKAFASYGAPEDQRATVAARILSGDPSALTPTPEQERFVGKIRSAMEGDRMFPLAGGEGQDGLSPYMQAAIMGAQQLGGQLQKQGQQQAPMPGQPPQQQQAPDPIASLAPYMMLLKQQRAAQQPQFHLGQPFQNQQPQQPQMVPGSLLWGMGNG